MSNRSLGEVYNSIDPDKSKTPWKRILSFVGPAYLVSVGYMDPGNWATDLAAGSEYKYKLIWVLLLSNIMAILLQTLCARLGIVARLDLAQANRQTYPRFFNYILWFLAEIAIASTDLAEVIGMAIGLKLLFGIDLEWGVMLTFLDTLLLLYLQRLGMRKLEAFIVALIAVIGISFLIQIVLAKPDLTEVATGLIPTSMNTSQLFIAIGILGATVMPHNLYLHSAIIQSRKVGKSKESIKRALKVSFWDNAIALNLAFFVNAAILVLAAAVFYKAGRHDIAGIEEAHQLLEPLLGSKLAPILFAVALIAAGQSSTITGTISGQIVMEGYLNIRLNPALRRLITRLIAIVPAMIVILIAGDQMVDYLLVLSQVILSFQLAFAVIPLIIFVSKKEIMGEWVINVPTRIAAWVVAGIITALNLYYVGDEFTRFFMETDSIMTKIVIVLFFILFVLALILTIVYPYIRRSSPPVTDIHSTPRTLNLSQAKIPTYNRIMVTVDFSTKDEEVLQTAISFMGPESVLFIVHVLESPVANYLGKETNVDEVKGDTRKLEAYVDQMQELGIQSQAILGYTYRVKEIASQVSNNDIDLLIMGAHKHQTMKDFVYGETINKVRHRIDIPLLIV